ncbi:NUDIX domain-containing protein [Streptomyces sp. H39-S7]
MIGQGETPDETAAREVEEEVGWRPGPMKPLRPPPWCLPVGA